MSLLPHESYGDGDSFVPLSSLQQNIARRNQRNPSSSIGDIGKTSTHAGYSQSISWPSNNMLV